MVAGYGLAQLAGMGMGNLRSAEKQNLRIGLLGSLAMALFRVAKAITAHASSTNATPLSASGRTTCFLEQPRITPLIWFKKADIFLAPVPIELLAVIVTVQESIQKM